ncbi:MerR family transcriptional regulator [Streptomyces scabiei]|uniref:MerR family transcriptional regulator n=1 Tax=Streptomyces scabiei TaxID=1930 RepID=UPI0027E09617|nr:MULTISPECIES: MerR family transcriptional regulator [Streptomyces]MDX2538867.1 MerR family transcriptional regulator [Streptomyces scabiei]MDX2802691.1 MerR family transcriptional regulator [Streptomyces scabiei]MDX3295019.1 MerR family transcriptional regulator [Streptomyces scabiei]MDX3829025.1 MerR family transcriptional regulator [Streptomyces scabiei]
MPDLYTGTQAAQMATQWRRTVSANAAAVTPQAICNWRARGHLKVSGLDEHDRPLYALPDLARAELATRSRALRLVGIGTPAPPADSDRQDHAAA